MYDRQAVRRVLEYLRDMIELCRAMHRRDLESDYRDAWETAAFAIYGKLPGFQNRGSYPAVAEKPQSTPPWKAAMLAKPFRKIIGRMGDYEFLECGHRLWSLYCGPAEPTAKRRRCAECAKEAANAAEKKPPSSAAQKSQRVTRGGSQCS